MDPDQTAPLWIHTVCNIAFLSNRQKTKHTTIVVLGILRVILGAVCYGVKVSGNLG